MEQNSVTCEIKDLRDAMRTALDTLHCALNAQSGPGKSLIDHYEKRISALRNALFTLAYPTSGEGKPYYGNDALDGEAGKFYKAYNSGINAAIAISKNVAGSALAADDEAGSTEPDGVK